MNRRILFLLVTVLLAGCGGQGAGPSATPTPALRNPLDVALYPNSEIVAVHTFQQVVTGDQTHGTVFEGGAGTYDGTEVLAANAASFSTLANWVHRFGTHVEAGTERYGLDYAAFQRGSGKFAHGVLVVVMDPQIVNRQFGSVLDLIGKYHSLPAFMRGPIDAQVKQRLGITLSDAMQPASPIGATLAALDEFQHRNSRGIVIIDAHRR